MLRLAAQAGPHATQLACMMHLPEPPDLQVHRAFSGLLLR
jgi:hypothetical protein